MANGKRISQDELNSESFVKLLKAQDPAAFEVMFDTLFPKIVGYLCAEFEFGEAEIEELASDALLKVYHALPKFDINGGAQLSTWVFKIAINLAIDHYRREKKLFAKAPIVDGGSADGTQVVTRQTVLDWKQRYSDSLEPSLDGHIRSDETNPMLRAFVSLTEPDRDILRMRHVMEYEEIAQVENRKTGALRVRYKRALDRLGNAYKKELGDAR